MAVQINPTGTGRVLPMGKLPPSPPHQVTVYAPDGTPVTVFQVDAQELCQRGFSLAPPESKPEPAVAVASPVDADVDAPKSGRRK